MITDWILETLKTNRLLSKRLARTTSIIYRGYFSDEEELEYTLERYHSGIFLNEDNEEDGRWDHGPELASDPAKTSIEQYTYHQFDSEGSPPVDWIKGSRFDSGFITGVCHGNGDLIKLIKCTMNDDGEPIITEVWSA